MRSIWVGLAVLFVLMVSLRITSSASNHQRRPPAVAVSQVDGPQKDVPEEDVATGYGVTAATARDRALEKAQQRVQELLARQLGGHAWRVPEELIEPEYLIRSKVLYSLGEPVAGPQLNKEDRPLLAVRYQVRLTP